MDWFVKICMALKHVHDQGLLHRELRPQVMLIEHHAKAISLKRAWIFFFRKRRVEKMSGFM
jgi:serine/threonine protein kinase